MPDLPDHQLALSRASGGKAESPDKSRKSSSTTSPHLSQELHDLIIGYLFDDDTALQACALVSKAFSVSSQKHIFRMVTLRPLEVSSVNADASRMNPCQLFHRLLEGSPHLGAYVQDLTLEEGQDDPSSVSNIPDDMMPFMGIKELAWVAKEKTLPLVLGALKNLKTLSFGRFIDWHILSVSLRRALLTAAPSLEHLELRKVRNWDLRLMAAFTALKTWKLWYTSFGSMDDGAEGEHDEHMAPHPNDPPEPHVADTSTGGPIADGVTPGPRLQTLHFYLEPEEVTKLTDYLMDFNCPMKLTRLRELLANSSNELDEFQAAQLLQLCPDTLERFNMTPPWISRHDGSYPIDLSRLRRLRSLTLDLSINRTHTARNHDPFDQLQGLLQPLQASETLVEVVLQTHTAVRDFSDLDGFRKVDAMLSHVQSLRNVRLAFRVMVSPFNLDAFKEAVLERMPSLRDRGILDIDAEADR
ncbi:hypothetical protein BD626DRAFT_155402 [Schizophyllum amplum]|uniref:F-box domain-containing protein n=1 Tax=Schizophyllum amplum TaxID=97359 RepID=A0A550C3V5_9AGAR|nr:hypothetical protein BD626DRAFT_155402 [Auriculariopsis ampla]